jgi:hypothetical protein
MIGFCVTGRTLYCRQRDLFPECSVYIQDSPQLHPFLCFRDHCHVGRGCFDTLARRVVALYDAVSPRFPRAKSLIVYFRFPNRQAPREMKSYLGIGGAWIDCTWARPPRLINPRHGYVLNPGGWKRLVELGTDVTRGGGLWEWTPLASLWQTGQAPTLIHGDAAMVALNPTLRPILEVNSASP